jgi:hypothetical protein
LTRISRGRKCFRQPLCHRRGPFARCQFTQCKSGPAAAYRVQMEAPAERHAPAQPSRGCALAAKAAPLPFALIALGALLLLPGCGSPPSQEPLSLPLVAGGRAVPLPPVQLARAASTARTFAAVYARSVYRTHRPRLPGATAAVEADLAAAASRVPLGRHRLRPHAGRVALQAISPDRVEASVEVIDGRSTPFAIAFTLRQINGRWLVVSISSPE